MSSSSAVTLALLDPSGCLSLEQVIRSFNAPISEEHTFAIVHEAMKCLKAMLKEDYNNSSLSGARSAREIKVAADGTIHPSTFLVEAKGAATAASVNDEGRTVLSLIMLFVVFFRG